MAAALACNIFLFFAPWQNWGKASRRTAFCQGRGGQSISKIYIRTCCGLAELGGCMFHEGKMRDKEEAKKLTEKAHFARLTDLKCFRSCRLTHYTWTWWTDHLTIQHLPLDTPCRNVTCLTPPGPQSGGVTLKVRSWNGDFGDRASRRFVVCWLRVTVVSIWKVNIQFFQKFLVVPRCSIHFDFVWEEDSLRATFIPWMIISSKRLTSTVVPNCIQAMLTKTCHSFKVPRCLEQDIGPRRKAWRSKRTAISLTDLSIWEMLRLRSVFLLEQKMWPNLVKHQVCIFLPSLLLA